MKLIITTLISLMLVQLLGDVLAPESVVVTAQTQEIICQEVGGPECAGADEDTAGGVAAAFINALSFFIGIISILVITIAGLMYAISSGNPDRTNRAREAIVYALIGIAVAVAAQAIVRFVIGSV